MVSDQEIASCVESLLLQAGPNAAASVPAVVRQLESKFGLDLSHKAAFIREQIDLFTAPQRLTAPKDHFLIHQYPQFQLHNRQMPALASAAQQQQQFFHQNMAVTAGAVPASSPFIHLPHHHELSFGCPAGGSQYQLGQLQHLPRAQSMSQGAVAVRPAGAVPAQKESAPKRRGGPGGLSKVCGVSPELQVIVGEPTMARTQIVKQLWAYIRKNNLQDPNNKRKIVCNDELRRVLETDSTDMFKMNKLLAKHIRPLDTTSSDVKKLKPAATEEGSIPEPKPDQYPVTISDALAKFLGTDEKEMLQSEASQRVWDYIKSNHLEDPMNAMVILCDSNLQELFGCESLSALGVSQLLSRHMFKKS